MSQSLPRPQLSMGLTTFAAADPGGWERLFDHARLFDRAGVDRLVVSDHVAFGENLEAYGRPEIGGVQGGKQPTGPDGLWLEPLTVLTAVGAVTSRVRLGTNILQAALRRPAVLAKTASTLDVLSGGRLDLGVGVGWQREEYEAAGLSFEGRGRLLDQTLEVLQALWREQRASYDGDGLRFENIHQMPKPVQPGECRSGSAARSTATSHGAWPGSAAAGFRGAPPPPTSGRASRRCAKPSPPRAGPRGTSRSSAPCGQHATTTANRTSRPRWSGCRNWSRRASPTCASRGPSPTTSTPPKRA
ncbi:LLM class flavin-dependent oxidoreductase [Yinghuangia aomiensis]